MLKGIIIESVISLLVCIVINQVSERESEVVLCACVRVYAREMLR
jgi:hypothetical protein